MDASWLRKGERVEDSLRENFCASDSSLAGTLRLFKEKLELGLGLGHMWVDHRMIMKNYDGQELEQRELEGLGNRILSPALLLSSLLPFGFWKVFVPANSDDLIVNVAFPVADLAYYHVSSQKYEVLVCAWEFVCIFCEEGRRREGEMIKHFSK